MAAPRRDRHPRALHDGYRPLWTGLGIIAFYCLAAFGLSFYQRRRIGARRWRSAHRFASLAFVLGGIHALMAGTDARSPLLLGLILGFGVIIAVLVAARALGLPAKPRRAERGKGPQGLPTRARGGAVVSSWRSGRGSADSVSRAGDERLGDTEPGRARINAGLVSFTAG